MGKRTNGKSASIKGRKEKERNRQEQIVRRSTAERDTGFCILPSPTGKTLRCHAAWQDAGSSGYHMTGAPCVAMRTHGFVPRFLFSFPAGRAISVSTLRGC